MNLSLSSWDVMRREVLAEVVFLEAAVYLVEWAVLTAQNHRHPFGHQFVESTCQRAPNVPVRLAQHQLKYATAMKVAEN